MCYEKSIFPPPRVPVALCLFVHAHRVDHDVAEEHASRLRIHGIKRIRGILGKNSTGTDSSLIGTVTYYRADGTSLKQEYWNKDGKRDSVWRWFDEAGNLLRESDLSNGGIIYGACDGHNDKFCAET